MNHPLRPLSSSNPRLKQLSRLARRRRDRDEQRALLVEGPTSLTAALDAGAMVREVYVADDRVDDPLVTTLLERLPPDTPAWSVNSGALERAGDAVTSQGILAVVYRPKAELPPAGPDGFVLLLADLADPGNVGTIIRTAVATGADAVVVAGGVDPTAPKVVRASAGAWFSVPIVARDDVVRAIEDVGGAGYRLVGTLVEGGTDHTSVDLGGAVALILGSEARGLDRTESQRLDERVTIAMAGPTESLNVAMAATVLSFEVLRQRRRR